MQYRTFGKLDWKPSALGFGAMRLPTTDDNPISGTSEHIDEDLAIRMIRAAIDGGVNYVDTAWPYHRERGEPLVGKALQDGYRKRVKLATKLPSWKIEKPEDCDEYLNTQLERLQTDHIDFYLLHAMDEAKWERMKEHRVVNWAEGAIRDGRIDHLGFSFHDKVDLFKEIVDAHDWTFCQIQYNYMDIELQAGTEGLRYAASRGLAVVIMEPLRGGALTQPAPEPVAKLWAGAPTKRTQAEWGLQWLWNQPEVSLVLSGMSAMRHVEENLASADRSGVGTLTGDELRTIDAVREAYRSLKAIPCTNCKYCMPCPNGVAIPTVLAYYNLARMYNNLDHMQAVYTDHTPAERRADQCV